MWLLLGTEGSRRICLSLQGLLMAVYGLDAARSSSNKTPLKSNYFSFITINLSSFISNDSQTGMADRWHSLPLDTSDQFSKTYFFPVDALFE